MAFYNSFLNFNMNFAQPGFGFNFGCFSMPNFFNSFSPWNFNIFGFNNTGFNPYGFNNFSLSSFNQMPFSQVYPTTNSTSSVFTGFTNNTWQNLNTTMPSFDTFTRTPVSATSTQSDWASSMNFNNTKVDKKNNKKTFSYSSSNDIHATQNANFMKNLTSEMQEKTKKLIAYANEKGYDVQISSGYRTQAEQNELKKKYANEPGRVADKSAHCEGKAIDIKVTKNGQESDAGYNLLGKYAKSELGMRWGGDFTSYRERWHFDYNWA